MIWCISIGWRNSCDNLFNILVTRLQLILSQRDSVLYYFFTNNLRYHLPTGFGCSTKPQPDSNRCCCLNYIHYFPKMKGNYIGVMSSDHLQQCLPNLTNGSMAPGPKEDHLNLTVQSADSLLCRFQTPTTSCSLIFSKAVLVEVNGFSARWAG